MVGTRSVSWSWGDGSGDHAAEVRGSKGAGNATASHTYAAPGIYSVTVTVTNGAGQSAAVSRKVIAYEPSGGYVGGSGELLSPSGAITAAPTQTGKATFSLMAPLNLRAQITGTKAQLHFGVTGLSFRSTYLRTVAVHGGRGQFVGSGTINGAGNYQFALSTTAGATANRGNVGRFSLKIWHIDPVTKAEVVHYDNHSNVSASAGGPIVEGRIVSE